MKGYKAIGIRRANAYNEMWREFGRRVVSLGGVEVRGIYDDMPEYDIETRYGALRVMPERQEPRDAILISLFTRFAEPQRAKSAGIDCNQYTGKWNHYWDLTPPTDPAEILADATRIIESVLPESGGAA